VVSEKLNLFKNNLTMLVNNIAEYIKLEAQWAEPVSLTFHFVLMKLDTEPSKMLPTKFLFIWPSGFRGEYVFEINQSETRIACGGHICELVGMK
jgi:hypothetical protein